MLPLPAASCGLRSYPSQIAARVSCVGVCLDPTENKNEPAAYVRFAVLRVRLDLGLRSCV